MSDLRAVLLAGHASDCRAVALVKNGSWTTPWYLTGKHSDEPRDSLGRRHKYGSYIAWLAVACNSINCNARAVVSCSDIEELILAALPAEPEDA